MGFSREVSTNGNRPFRADDDSALVVEDPRRSLISHRAMTSVFPIQTDTCVLSAIEVSSRSVVAIGLTFSPFHRYTTTEG